MRIIRFFHLFFLGKQNRRAIFLLVLVKTRRFSQAGTPVPVISALSSTRHGYAVGRELNTPNNRKTMASRTSDRSRSKLCASTPLVREGREAGAAGPLSSLGIEMSGTTVILNNAGQEYKVRPP